MMKFRMMQCACAKPAGMRLIRQATLGGGLSLLALTILAPPSARAEDIFRMMGINIGIENQIDYRERSPLVVPPSRELPPPQASGTARNPNWPADADIARRKELEKRKKLDQTFDYDRFTKSLSPSELGPAGAGAGTQRSAAGGSGDMTAPLRPSELGSFGFFGSLFKGSNSDQKMGAAVVEPPRRSLTEPPAGYQTPSPNQPYAITPPSDNAKAKKQDVPAGEEGP